MATATQRIVYIAEGDPIELQAIYDQVIEWIRATPGITAIIESGVELSAKEPGP